MDMIKFSIIVPVYNVENYLGRCVESILGQSFSDYELLLINDGSTDQSGLICDQIAESNKNIKVTHKENGGLSEARNAGLGIARGEYIIFVDSDDYIELGTLEKFNIELEKSGSPEVMITKSKTIYGNSDTRYMDKSMPVETIKKGNKGEIINWMFSYSNSLWPSVKYIVKRSFIESKNLRFAVGYLHEDLDWTSKLFLYAKTFTVLDFYWYNHLMGRHESITTNKNPKRTLDVIKLVYDNINNVHYNELDLKTRNVMFQRMVLSLFFSLSDYKFYNQSEKRDVVEILKDKSTVFKYTSKFKHKVFINFCTLFGFKAGLTIISLVRRN